MWLPVSFNSNTGPGQVWDAISNPKKNYKTVSSTWSLTLGDQVLGAPWT